MRKVIKLLKYIVAIISTPKQFSEALNKSKDPEELDEYVCGGK